MARSKTYKELEHYIGTIKELKSTVRKLQRELRYFQKREHLTEDVISGAIEAVEETKDKKERCPVCSENGIDFIVIANRGFKKCSLCDYRSNSIKINTDDKK